MTGTQRKARRSREVRRSGGRRRETMKASRAGELPTGTVRTTEPVPVESLTANGRRRSGWQGTAAREEFEQPRRIWKGGASFGCLPYFRSGNRTRHVMRPRNLLRPVVREPLHRTLKYAGGDVATLRNVVELGASVEHDRRDALAAYAERFAIAICDCKELATHVHGAFMRSFVLIVNGQLSA